MSAIFNLTRYQIAYFGLDKTERICREQSKWGWNNDIFLSFFDAVEIIVEKGENIVH